MDHRVASRSRTSALAYGATVVLRDISARDRAGRVLRAARAVGLRQVDAAAPARRLRSQPTRDACSSTARDVAGAAAVEARHRHGVPELRAVAAHDGRARTSPSASRSGSWPRERDHAPRRSARSTWSASPSYGDAPPEPALRRPAAARGARAHDRHRAAVLLLDEPLSNLDAKLRVSTRARTAARCSASSASPRSSSPTTRRRRCRSPTASRCSTTA